MAKNNSDKKETSSSFGRLGSWFGNIVSPKSPVPAPTPVQALGKSAPSTAKAMQQPAILSSKPTVTKDDFPTQPVEETAPKITASLPATTSSGVATALKKSSLPIAIKGSINTRDLEAPTPISASLVPLQRVEGEELESEIEKQKQIVEKWKQEARAKDVPSQNATGQRYEEEMGLFNLEIEIPLGDAPSRPDTPEQEREQADTSRSATPSNESGSEEEEKSLDFTGNQGKISMASSLPPVKFIGHIKDDSFEVGRPGERFQARTRMWASQDTNPFLKALGKYEANGVGSTTPKPEKRDKPWQDNLKISREQGGFSQQGL